MADTLRDTIDSVLGADPLAVTPAPGVPQDPLKEWIDKSIPAPAAKQAPTAAPAAPKQNQLFADIDNVTGGPEKFAPAAPVMGPGEGVFPVPVERTPEQPEQPAERPGYFEAQMRGVSRGVDMIRSAVPTLQGVYSEWSGDPVAVARYAAEAKEIDDAAYKPVVGGFSNIKNAEDALYWMLETGGEMSPMLAAVMIGGYVGARASPAVVTPVLLHSAVRMGVMSPQAAAAWGPIVGSVLGGSLVSIPLETADTASELREVKGSYHPEV